MKVTNELGLKTLAASCPSCGSESLYCGWVDSKIRGLKDKEILYCRRCKFVIPVQEFKNRLFTT